MMQEGMRDRNGERLQGLRELMDKLRQQRQERLDRYDLGGVYSEIADELNDIVDEERHAIENATQRTPSAAATSAARRRRATPPPTATSASTCCPTTSPARSASCRHTTSSRPRPRSVSSS